MKDHMERKDFDIKGHDECKTCGISFNMARVLKKHAETHKTYENVKCGICNKSFSSTERLMLHEKLHNK